MDEKHHGTTCPPYEALLEDFLNGGLGANDAKTLGEHLNGCVGCRRALQDASASTRLLRAAGPTPDPGPGYARVVMARIAAEEAAAEGNGFWQPFVSLAWRFAARAAFGLVMLVGYDAMGHAGLMSDATTVRQGEVRDLFSTDPAFPPKSSDDVLMLVAETNHGNN